MRTIYQIIIICLIALSVFLAREDVLVVYNKVVAHMNNSVSNLLNNNENITAPSDPKLKDNSTDNVIDTSANVKTPGALVVKETINLSDILNNNSANKFSNLNIIKITNKYRKENGNLLPLAINEKLNFSAEKKLEDILSKQYFEHISPEGVGVGDLANEVSYEYITIGENLALGNFSNDQALVDAWMASPGHRKNILNNHYSEIGVAVKEGMYEGKKVWVSVQHFGLPKSFCPEVDQVMYGIINITEDQVKKIEEDLAIRKEMIEKRVVYEGLTTNEQISKYNGMVIIYNDLVFDLKNKIETYNKQIKDFNACLLANTSSAQ
jgi:uncharacterized protein YkwD